MLIFSVSDYKYNHKAFKNTFYNIYFWNYLPNIWDHIGCIKLTQGPGSEYPWYRLSLMALVTNIYLKDSRMCIPETSQIIENGPDYLL